MRSVVQRVSQSCVRVDGEIVGQIGKGFLVLLGVGGNDTSQDLDWMVDKIIGLRVFEDEAGKMNRSILEEKGGILLVSQFTLYGDCRKGRRPSFSSAASPEKAKALYEEAISKIVLRGVHVETGIFQADMKVELVNDGPVTLLLDSEKTF
ncbi:D-aminoacyl-tRNA deacylase [Desulfitobacterium metallireducens]|uniref:D-aminoacyl-tRNA deacylase n=1 Tax=Desulfitobacterium metallireducens DSM 15288 TaxID=871968 RepID=W0ED53_9FIRM|nr:D-aminoacyl-tRNA deacylase [Desulfitobacterium metallireducens]AHF07463.1 D-tyrosyl-tRNA(Tyr) deacylase [Desulfitobacterium metallireducens DSM 15288]